MNDFTKLWDAAHAAGMRAGEMAKPNAMTVQEASTGRSWHVPDGPCGFAWITVSPGTSSFARWAKQNRGARRAYQGGMQIKWVSEFSQSLERKAAYAMAFAATLREAGIKAYHHSRID